MVQVCVDANNIISKAFAQAFYSSEYVGDLRYLNGVGVRFMQYSVNRDKLYLDIPRKQLEN